MTPEEHARRAEELVAEAEEDRNILLDSAGGGEDDGSYVDIGCTLQIAQVHATLALYGITKGQR